MTPDTEKRRWPWLRILLIGSLALNLLVVGLVIGAALRFGGPDRAHRPPPPMGAALYRALPRDERRAFRKAMQEAPFNPSRNRQAQARALADVLRATPFQPTALSEALAGHADERAAWQATVHAVWMDRVREMSDAERAAYADRVEEEMANPHWKRRKRDDRQD